MSTEAIIILSILCLVIALSFKNTKKNKCNVIGNGNDIVQSSKGKSLTVIGNDNIIDQK